MFQLSVFNFILKFQAFQLYNILVTLWSNALLTLPLAPRARRAGPSVLVNKRIWRIKNRFLKSYFLSLALLKLVRATLASSALHYFGAGFNSRYTGARQGWAPATVLIPSLKAARPLDNIGHYSTALKKNQTLRIKTKKENFETKTKMYNRVD